MADFGKEAASLQGLLREARRYVRLQKRRLQLDAADKLTVLLSATAAAAVCLVVASLALLFLMLALASLVGQLAGSPWVGHLAMALALLLALLLLIAKRRKWITQPVARMMLALFGGDGAEEDGDA